MLRRWNQNFDFVLEPSELTPCPILYSEIMRMDMKGKAQYMVIMVRRDKKGKMFLTAYDPKSAKEYVCKDVSKFLKEKKWLERWEGPEPLKKDEKSTTSQAVKAEERRIADVSEHLSTLIVVSRPDEQSSVKIQAAFSY